MKKNLECRWLKNGDYKVKLSTIISTAGGTPTEIKGWVNELLRVAKTLERQADAEVLEAALARDFAGVD